MNAEAPKKVGLSSTLAQQQFNMMANLQHRMEVAVANCDSPLLEALTQERIQLESYRRDFPSPTHRWPTVIQGLRWLMKAIISRRQLSVERRVNETGEEWWYVFDPGSGKTFNAESLSVALHWIERNQLGH